MELITHPNQRGRMRGKLVHVLPAGNKITADACF